LEAALEYVSQQTKLPVGDFFHLWRVFCNKIKNHNGTLIQDLPDPCSLSVDSLKSTLNFGAVLKDRSAIDKMRDSYALQLFSLEN
jgi:hypothetical protein